MTGKDTLGIKVGSLTFNKKWQDRESLLIDKVRYIGDPIAAVAAIDEDTAEQAIRLIKVEYEELPAVFTVEEAAAEGAPLIHEDMPGNITRIIRFNFGEVDHAFADSYYVREDRFSPQAQAQVPLEPRTCTASYEGGKLTVWVGTMRPTGHHFTLAQALGLPRSDIRVILPYAGGAFGGKAEISAVEFCPCASPTREKKSSNARFAAIHFQ